jgi:2-oxoglutarate ferredoxin oxidoreductase subunit alpha
MPVNNQAPAVRLIQGNEACAEGAIIAGCRFYAGYPITPSSEIAEVLSYRLPAVDGTFIQMEDEIASMGAVIGASLAGAKAMTATSGPGFSLMQENLGFACMAEAPCVLVNVMRGGPSRAFNLAEKYRTPVIFLMDEVIGHMRENIVLPSPGEFEIFQRIRPSVPPEWSIPYEDTEFGVPPVGDFGGGYRYHVTGLIHDQRGFPTLREDEVESIMNRLFRKIWSNLDDIQTWEEFMLDDAEVCVVAYGSVARSAKNAVVQARQQGIKAGLLRLITIWPFCRQAVEKHISRYKKFVVPEMNMGQISREVKRVVQGRAPVDTVNRIIGRLIRPDEILAAIKGEES